jgi:NADPH:quinone reductase-like Zn-dependent oxidoreductase
MIAKFLVGKRVGFIKQPEIGSYKVGGAYADYMVTDYKSCIPIPEDFNFDQSASFFVNPLTAVCMVERVKTLKSKCCIVTAAASQIGGMLIKLLLRNGVTPIMTVRREEQAENLRAALGPKLGKLVVNTSSKNYKKEMGAICMKLKPSTCLECIAGEMTGEILDFMGFESTVILYGLLSDKPASGIKVINFIGKAQTIESFILMNYLSKKTLTQYFELIL